MNDLIIGILERNEIDPKQVVNTDEGDRTALRILEAAIALALYKIKMS